MEHVGFVYNVKNVSDVTYLNDSNRVTYAIKSILRAL